VGFLYIRHGSGGTTLASPDALLLSPPLFLEKIYCLAMIMGEYRDLGQGPGFDEKEKDGKSRPTLKRF